MNSAPLALFNGSYIGTQPTGIAVVARDLVDALDPNIVQFLDPLGGDRIGSIAIPKNLTSDFGTRGHIRRLLWTQKWLPYLINRTSAEFLISPLPEAPLFRGVRSLVLAHDLIPLRYPQFTPLLTYHLTYVPMVLHSAVRVLCNSEATAREVHGRLKIPLKKLVTIPLGFRKENLFPLYLKREPFFLVLGRHDPHKNLARIIHALSLLRDEEMNLLFVGPHDQRYTPKLKKIALRLGVARKCKWISWVTDEERLRLINSCQALVIASLWEGFGLPALEAMACKTPVIASNAGALPEVVGDAGIIVNPKVVEEITDAMWEISNNNLLRKTLESRSESRLEYYQWSRTASLIEKLLLEI